MKALIENIARALVDDPDQVFVSESDEGSTSTIELRVAPDDLGKVIGRRGRTASAMRNLLTAAATRQNKRAILEIVE